MRNQKEHFRYALQCSDILLWIKNNSYIGLERKWEPEACIRGENHRSVTHLLSNAIEILTFSSACKNPNESSEWFHVVPTGIKLGLSSLSLKNKMKPIILAHDPF